jgi:Calcineurin-like phosphoesterase
MTSDHGRGVSRRKILECMTWAGTGVLWTIAGGTPRSMGIIGEAMAAESSGLMFLQISDSHVGFDKPANPNALGTLEEAINKIKTMPVKPSFVIHTGDITHLSRPSEFDNADRIISQARLDVHYVPGEHDVLDGDVTLYRDRYGRDTKGAGWYSFDANGVHSSALSTLLISRPAASAISATTSSNGWRTTSRGDPRPPQSSSSRTSRFGAFIRNGDGAQTMLLALSTILSASAR